jgi:hypothetical protein
MEEIAAGNGRRPKPFMLAGRAAASDAVWHSNRKGNLSRASFLKTIEQPKTRSPPRKRTGTKMPQFIAPQLCRRVSRPPVGADWVHEIKLDGYRMQLLAVKRPCAPARVSTGRRISHCRAGLFISGTAPTRLGQAKLPYQPIISLAPAAL